MSPFASAPRPGRRSGEERAIAGLAVVVLVATVGASVAAAAPVVVRIVGAPGPCPSIAVIAALLRESAPEVQVATADEGPGLRVVVEDRGPRYRVVIDGVGRTLEDPSRSCRERARAVAVIVALALAPRASTPEPSPRAAVPRVERAPLAKPSVPAPKDGPPRISRAALRWRGTLELALGTELAPAGAGGHLVAGELGLRAALERGAVGAVLGAALLSPSTQSLGASASLRYVRAPFDVSLRARLGRPAPSLEVGADVGLAAVVLYLRSAGLAEIAETSRVAFGVRAAPWLRWWVSPRAALHGSLVVTAVGNEFELASTPSGVLGTTPRLFLGAQVGLSLRL